MSKIQTIINLEQSHRDKAGHLGAGNMSRGVRQALDAIELGGDLDNGRSVVQVTVPTHWKDALVVLGDGDVSRGFERALKNPRVAGLFFSR